MSNSSKLTGDAFKALFTGGGTPADRMGRLKQVIASEVQNTIINVETPEGQTAAWWFGGILNNVADRVARPIREFRHTAAGALRANSPALTI